MRRSLVGQPRPAPARTDRGRPRSLSPASATVAAVLAATSLLLPGGAGAATGDVPPDPRGAATPTVSVTSSRARVRATAYDGGGPTQHVDDKPGSGFEVFDKVAKADDTDDADRGARGDATQFTSIVSDSSTITVHSAGGGTARLYDQAPTDDHPPVASGLSELTVTIDVAGGKAFWTLRATLEGDSDPRNLGCGSALLTSPDGSVTRANGECELDDAVTIDRSGALDPGIHTLAVTAGGSVGTDNGRRVRAGGSYDLVFMVSACTVLGTPDGEPLDGTSGDDVICGLGGPDTIEGFAGDDTIFGGPGADDIAGGPGNDVIFGGDGDDVIQGGSGSDSIFGGPDRDRISDLGGPNGLLSGDAGSDTICGSNQRDRIRGGADVDIVIGLGGPDTMWGDTGNDVLIGDGTADMVQTFECDPPSGSPSGDQGDTIDGGPGSDTLGGGDGPDVLVGGSGDDQVSGGPAGDRITGGRGKDVLRGDAASDTLDACDGVRDTVIGGAGANDVAKRDVGIDRVRADIEVRRRC